MIRTAVVILNYNGNDYLGRFLPGVIANSPDAEIVVADNGSTDSSVELLTSRFPSVRLIRLDRNYGFAGGYNRAVPQINADLLVLLNSDVEVTPSWLDPIASAFAEDPHLAAAQPKILSHQNRALFDYAGAAGGFLDRLGYPYCRGRIFSTIEADRGQYDDTRDVFWASGACLFIRKSVFEQAGGFDEDFFAHMEEIDLCWRIRRMNLKIRCIPASVVYHVGGGTLSRQSPRKTYLNFRNSLSVLVKNSPPADLLWKLPLRIILDGMAAIKFLTEGSARHFLAVIKAHVRFWPGAVRDYRKLSGGGRSSRGLSARMIVFQYYLRRRKLFSDLTSQ
jgi:hypothetical protein